ncbi:hypothetical protein FS837_002584 [Tulasnella sp. UAMH 9824]|nr:hypothetical protein FS837_002584 [Tulasnella sp. UAMH 9824]
MYPTRTRHRTPLDPALSKIPEPPEEFGQDGGKFYECYDKLAADMDEETTYVLKEQLEGLLLFVFALTRTPQAGLFAGINTTFLFLTLPMMWSDAFMDTNALIGQTNSILVQIALGRNGSIPSYVDLPSTSYTPSSEIVTINVLFCLSLTFAVISSFLAMLGRQWLFYYRKQGGGGPDRERWEQLQRFLGARRWRLELILDDVLPSLLQMGLIIFCFAFVTFLRTLSHRVSTIVSIPLLLALTFFMGTALCVTWDKFCPFQSPLSHFFEGVLHSISRIVTLFAKGFISFSQSLKEVWTTGTFGDQRHTPAQIINAIQEFEFNSILDGSPRVNRLFRTLKSGRKEDPLESLQIFALQRSVCTSEDPVTLLCAVANIPTITNPKHVQKLWEDKAFQERLIKLYMGSFDRTLRLLGRDQVDLAREAEQLYGAAVTHILFYLDSVKSISDNLLKCLRDTEGFKPLGVRAPKSISADTLPVFVQTSLAHALISILQFPPLISDVQNLCAHINSCSDALVYPDWKLLSLVSWAIAQLPRIGSLYNSDFERMARAFMGDVDTTPELINKAFEVITARKDVYTLDCERVLTNLLTCSSQVVTDECPHPEMRMDQILVLLRCAEKALRSASGSSEARTLVGRMRDAVSPKFKKACVREHSLWSEITTVSPEVLDTLISLFEALVEPSPTKSSKDEDMQTFRAFKPLLDNILSAETVFGWESGEHTADELPTSLVQRLNTLRQVLKQFIPDLDVYQDDLETPETDDSVNDGSSA